MKLGNVIFLCLLLWVGVGTLSAQSPAALAQLQQRYTPEQLSDMSQNTHYKYAGLLLFYAHSFQVVENGALRAATEAEIAAIDLDRYNHLRQAEASVHVPETELGLEIVLLSRAEFETLVLASYDVRDRAAYLAYKAQALQDATAKSTE